MAYLDVYGWVLIILGVILLFVAAATLSKNCTGFKNSFAITMNVFSIGYSLQFIVSGIIFVIIHFHKHNLRRLYSLTTYFTLYLFRGGFIAWSLFKLKIIPSGSVQLYTHLHS